ncbi:MAG: hypothetical protein ABFE07_29480 [Armatimonadia bacterium]
MMIAAFQRRQEIEAARVYALVTAAANPAGAPEAYLRFLRKLMPEYDGMRNQMDQELMESLHRDRDTVFRLDGTGYGWRATQQKLEPAGA